MGARHRIRRVSPPGPGASQAANHPPLGEHSPASYDGRGDLDAGMTGSAMVRDGGRRSDAPIDRQNRQLISYV